MLVWQCSDGPKRMSASSLLHSRLHPLNSLTPTWFRDHERGRSCPFTEGRLATQGVFNGPEALLFNKNRAAVNGGPKLLDQSWNAPPLRRCSHTEALIVRDRCDDRHRYWVT